MKKIFSRSHSKDDEGSPATKHAAPTPVDRSYSYEKFDLYIDKLFSRPIEMRQSKKHSAESDDDDDEDGAEVNPFAQSHTKIKPSKATFSAQLAFGRPSATSSQQGSETQNTEVHIPKLNFSIKITNDNIEQEQKTQTTGSKKSLGTPQIAILAHSDSGKCVYESVLSDSENIAISGERELVDSSLIEGSSISVKANSNYDIDIELSGGLKTVESDMLNPYSVSESDIPTSYAATIEEEEEEKEAKQEDDNMLSAYTVSDTPYTTLTKEEEEEENLSPYILHLDHSREGLKNSRYVKKEDGDDEFNVYSLTDSNESKEGAEKDGEGLPPGILNARQAFLTASAPLVPIKPLTESPVRSHSNTLTGESVKDSRTPLNTSLRIHPIDDWNGRFQKCVNEVKNSKGVQNKLVDAFRDLISLSQDFLHSAKTYGKLIIDEHELPYEQKTIKPCENQAGIIGGAKYIVANMIFKFAVGGDFIGGFTDTVAAKIAGHELKGLLGYYNCGVKGFHVPMIALLDYRGYRVLAISLLPINKYSLQYGTNDAAKTIAYNLNPSQLNSLKRAAVKLNIKPHICQTVKTHEQYEMYSPCDLEGHIGTDGSFYLLDFSRVFPPEHPSKLIGCSHLFRLLRPEFVKQYHKPLCSDGYSGFIKGLPGAREHNAEIKEATQFLLNTVIPDLGNYLSIKIQTAISFHENLETFPLTRLVHTRGVNLRYLPKIRAHCPHPKGKALIMIEMIVRTLKQFLRKETREEMKRLQIPVEAPYKKLMISHLNNIFNPHNPDFWKMKGGKLVALLTEKYAVDGQVFEANEGSTFDLRAYVKTSLGDIDGMSLLATKLVSVVGIKLERMIAKESQGNLLDLTSLVPLEELDIKALKVRVKHMNLVAHAEGYLLKLRARVSQNNESKRKLLEGSFAKFEEALNSTPLDKYTLRNCANALKDMWELKRKLNKDYDSTIEFKAAVIKAESYFKDAFRIDPKDFWSRYHYALFIWHSLPFSTAEELERRENTFLQLLEVDPQDETMLQIYASFLSALGRSATSSKVSQRIAEIRKFIRAH